jgi:hypothetical protein
VAREWRLNLENGAAGPAWPREHMRWSMYIQKHIAHMAREIREHCRHGHIHVESVYDL